MAYHSERYVNPEADAGGDGTEDVLTGGTCAFQSLNVWEAACDADITETDGALVHCKSDDGEGNHDADTTQTTILGWTTDSDSVITIQIDSANRPGGKYLL